MDEQILEVLKDIRTEAKQTNVRLESIEGRVDTTNARLESIEGRVDTTNARLESLEGRVDTTNVRLESLEGRVDTTNARLESLEGRVDTTNASLESLEGRVNTTNAGLESLGGRIDTTNAGLESLGERIEFLDKRVTHGFDDLAERLDRHVDRMDDLSRRQIESEIRLSTEVLSLADVTRDVRDLLARKLDDHAAVIDHEERIRSIEDRIADKDVER